jgi:hypothetical protein
MGTRKELTQALVQRYHLAPRSERSVILDEFAELTQYHRKHAVRVLNRPVSKPVPAAARNRLYDEVVRQAPEGAGSDADRCHASSRSYRPGSGSPHQAC